ncbi:4Fe-4S binding protein [Streptomyces sp. NPDC048479]|uniref:indolepyruvate ferredoxin oxidoreductase subunit alpha n=1 Tax=Streptomyces sp. NPDC048479 TaxID=3154725 RepID=UPI003434D908
MSYAIGEPCIDVMDKYCVEECPVDAIYEGIRKMYIQPDECIDCGACAEVCPTAAVSLVSPALAHDSIAAQDARFFAEPLPGRTQSLGTPGGATVMGPTGADTPVVTAFTR